MVEAAELYKTLYHKPFQPFRVYLTNGRIYDIRYWELNHVCSDCFAIGIPMPNDPDPVADRIIHVPLEQIDRIEMLNEPAPVIPW